MKSDIFAFLALTACGMTGAQDLGRVISSTPVIQQVAVPQRTCNRESVLVERHRGGGAIIGAIAGGAIGNAIGHGGGRALGTMIGIIGGAAVGDRLEGHGTADQVQQVQRCTTHTAFENRILHYDVVYEYAGRRYAARLPQDPGPTVQLQITPAGVIPPIPVAAAPMPAYVVPGASHIYSAVEYVPYAAPFAIALPPVVFGRYPRHRGRAERGFAPYTRHSRTGRARYRH